ncbi:MAG: TIGR03790 family protein [Chlorobi bacterium]|nr:TIGR03790 family protein [Chlorobiota bacterium]
MKDSLNYLVTTKGVPLGVNRGDLGKTSSKSASVDSELMLILDTFRVQIGQATLIVPGGQIRAHPYFSRNERFNRNRFHMYLVTRLTGLTKENVFSYIDRSGPFTLVDKAKAKFILDMDPRRSGGGYARYNNNLSAAATVLKSKGWNVVLNTDSVFVTKQTDVLGYASWGSNDHYDHLYTEKARPKNTWLSGSIAETYVSTSARNFQPGKEAGQSRIADLLVEGCTGASGYVFEPFTVALAWVQILFDRYTSGYNLAESYYMSMPTMSWMAVVVGDPKTSIITSYPPLPSPSIMAINDVCVNDPVILRSQNTQPGNFFWYNADSATVKAAGPPYDHRHPNFIGEGAWITLKTDVPGDFTYSFANENITGIGFAEVSFQVKSPLNAGFTVSADTVYLNESGLVQFSDTTFGATSWNWSFGDGTGTASQKSPVYTYSNPGTYTVQLEVSNGACTTTVTRMIVVLASRPTLTFTPGNVFFGNVAVSNKAQKMVNVRNISGGDLTITSASFTGKGAGAFGLPSVAFPVTLGASESVDWNITFAPPDTGEYRATLEISIDITQTAVSVDLFGRGVKNPSGIDEVYTAPDEFHLEQNFPNPFQSATRISYELYREGMVSVEIYDVFGRKVMAILGKYQKPGTYTIVFDASHLSAGVYLYKLQVNHRAQWKKMTITR